jgi:hypothetical protein
LPISFVAAQYEQSPSVTIFPRSPVSLHDSLEKFQRRDLARFAVTTASKTSPS